ncbi:MAG: T9SS type A sorting domain-containing protein [Bacteroidota bacterium]
MTIQVKKISTYIILLFLFTTTRVNATQLSGTYTINPSASVTTTNFHNFYSAIAFMTGGTRNDSGTNNTSPFGVSTPVIFIVAAGIYSEQVILTTSIVGTSPTNTVTFDGVNSNSRIITYSSTPTINVNNNPYLIFKNFTVNNTFTSSGACGIQIVGSSNSCRISSCNINISAYGFNCNGIALGGNRIDSTLIDSNIISGGLQGIYASQSSTDYQNKIIYNQIINYSGWGIRMNTQTGINIINNTLRSNSASSSSGISCNISNIGGNSIIITGNKIYNFAGTGLAVTGNNTSSNKGMITNNMIGGGIKNTNAYGINLSGNYWSIANNSFNYDSVSSGNSYCPINIQSASSGISIINNICSVKKNNNLALPLYIANATSIDTMDYNVFYRADTSDHLLIYLGAYYNSWNFKGAAGFNQHSQYINPGFVNDTNLHMSIPCLTGTILPYITTDIDGNTRNYPPNIGANEVQRFSNDMSPTIIVSPTYPIAVGSQNLRVRVINYGTNTVYSFNLSYKLNGNTPVTQAWSGMLNPCDTLSLTFTGSQQITIPSGTNILKVYSSNPNYTTDGNLLNDTITSIFVTAMGGNYVIGAAPSNYTTFGTAIADLNTYGVGSAVRFLVKTGTYNENLIVATPTGASATNTISFSSISNNADSVIVNANGVYTLNLSGSYFSFNKITFNQVSSTTAGAITFTGTPSFDTIYGCKLIAPNTSTTASKVVYGNGVTLNNIMLRKNTIQGGYANLNIVSSSSAYSTNCIIDSNILQNTNNTTFIEYFTNLKFRNNTVNVNTNTNYFTIEYANAGYEFTGNQINVSSGFIANMYLSYYCAGTSTNRIKINNNIFTSASTGSINLFAPYYYSGFVDFYNNSMALGNGFLQIGYNSNDLRCCNNSISSNNATYSFYQNESSNTNVDVKNNVISNTNGGVALYWNNTPSGTIFDYNNLYTTGSNLVSVSSGATIYSNLSAWRSAYGLDKNSLSYRPAFINSANNLAPNTTDSACWSMNGRGMPATFITTDINGNARSSQILNGATDIGAYEFTPSVNPPLAVASPYTPAASTTQYFSFGSDTIAQIVWGTSVPSSITAQMYSGTNAPQVGSNSFYQTNAYWNITAPAGTYSYNLKLNYHKNGLQNIPSETNMVIAQKSTGINWGIASSTHTIDTINNIMSANGLTHFSYFAGTDATFPLPVQLVSFEVKPIGNEQNAIGKWQVMCTWQTASEVNNDYFEVERSSMVNSQWSIIGKVKGNGTTNSVSNYLFTDVLLLDFARSDKANNKQQTSSNLYYRIRQTDFDGNSTLSDVRVININQSTNQPINIYPNPARDELHIETTGNEKIVVQLFDLTGKNVVENFIFTNSTIINTSSLYQGIYFIRITDADGAVVKIQKVAVVR